MPIIIRLKKKVSHWEKKIWTGEKMKKLAASVAEKAVKSLEGAGVFAVELFLTNDNQVCSNIYACLI